MHIDEAEAVWPAQHDPGARTQCLQVALAGTPFLPELRKPTREHHGGPQAVGSAFLQCRGDLVSRHGQHRALRGLGQINEPSVCRQASDFRGVRVHRKDAAGVAEPAQVHDDIIAERILSR